MSDDETGVVEDPDSGFQLGGEVIDSAAAGLQALVDILSTLFRVYLFTSTTFLMIVFVLFVVIYYIGQWPNRYGTQMQLKRTRRTAIGLFLVSIILPILYLAGWIGSGSTTHDGLPSDGIFGTSLEDRIIGPSVGSDGLGMFVDVVLAFFRIYLATVTMFLLIIASLFIAARILMKLHVYGAQIQHQRTIRTLSGLFFVTVLLPLLYVPIWIATGSQSPDGWDLPSDGVFGTSFEERLFGPDPGEGGFGHLISILAEIVHTYQVTISFVLISILVFLSVLYFSAQWPKERDGSIHLERIRRAALGTLASLTFIPILYAIAWIGTGFFTPDESMTWVAPRISLPYEELFEGPRYHPFMQDLSASSDPLAAVLRNIMRFHVTTLLYVGIAAVVTGVLFYVFLSKSNYLQTDFGQQSLYGGVVIIVIVFLAPSLVTGIAWIATGVPGDGYLGDGPPGFSSQCTSFEDGDIAEWEVVEGSYSGVADPYGIELDGTISQEFIDLNLGDRSITVYTITEGEPIDVRLYDGDELVLDETTEHDATYIHNTDHDVRVEISANGAQLEQACVGFEPMSDPQLDVALADIEDEFILREGITIQYTVYNVGEVQTPSDFHVGFSLNGTDPWGVPAREAERHHMDQMAGGEFTDDVVYFDDFSNPPVGTVRLESHADPEGVLDERTTVPNIDDTLITVLYANHETDIEAELVNNNGTILETTTVNTGTAYSLTTTADVTIYDDDEGGTVADWTVPVDELDPDEAQHDTFEHVFRTPGNYTAEIDVDDEIFPRGSVAQENITFYSGDLRGHLVDVEDESRVGTQTEFDVQVVNEGNAKFDENTTASVQVIDPDGNVVDEQEVQVPNLDVGEQYEETISTSLEVGGYHTIELDVHDPDYPIGTTDSAQIMSVGPSLSSTVHTPDIHEGEVPDVTARVTNDGTDDAESTLMHAVLYDSSGSVVEEQTVFVPSLSPDETFSESPFESALTEAGDYDVEIDVEPTPDTNGAESAGSFEVLYSDVGINVEPRPVSGNDEVVFDVTVVNNGTGETRTSMDVDLEVTDDADEIVATDTLTFSSISGNSDRTLSSRLELEEGGLHTVEGVLKIEDEPTDIVEFEHYWPDLSAEIRATELVVQGAESDVETTVTNVGSEQSDSTTAEVIVYDSFYNIVFIDTFGVERLEPGESQVTNQTVEFSDLGNYVVELDVDDPEFPENSTDTTEEIEVQQSELRMELNEHQSPIAAGEEGIVDVVIENVGTYTSDEQIVETEFVAPDGSLVAEFEEEVNPIGPGEETVVTESVELHAIGTHDVRGVMETDLSGTVTGSTQIEVIEPFIIDVTPVQSEVPVGEEGEVEVTVQNIGDEPRDPKVLETVFVDPDGEVVGDFEEEIDGLDPNEQTMKTYNVTLGDAGVYDIGAEIELEETVVRDLAEIEAVQSDLLLDVSAVDRGIGVSEDGELVAEIENAGTAGSGERPLSVEFTFEDGSTVDQWETSVDNIPPGETTEIHLSSDQLDEVGEYEGTVELETSDSESIEDSDTIEVLPPELRADVSAIDIEEGESVEIETTIENTAPSTSDPTTATVILRERFGSQVAEEEIDVAALGPNEDQVDEPFDLTIADPGVYEVDIEIESADSNLGEDQDRFEVLYWDLQANIVAEDEDRTAWHEIEVQVPNDGTTTSEPTTADVIIYGPSGTPVVDQTIDVPSVSSGSTYTQTIEFEAQDGGEHTAEMDVVDEDRPDGTTDERSFVVTWGDLVASIDADDEIYGSEGEMRITVENIGPGESYPTSGSVDVLDSFGNPIDQYTVSVPTIESEETYETTVTHRFIRPSTYQGHLEVNYPEYPEGTVDTTDEIDVIHGNLYADISWDDTSSDVGTETSFTVDVTNVGNDVAEGTTADVEVRNDVGEVVYEEEMDVDSLVPGATDSESFELVLNDSGTHVGSVAVDYPEFPIGNEDEDDIVVLSPDLRVDLDITDTEMGDQSEVTITITNHGDLTSETTIVEVLMFNDAGDRVVREELGVQSLGAGQTVEIRYTQLIAAQCWRTEMTCEPGASMDYGTYTGTADVEVEYEPQGSTAEDTFLVYERSN